jgi:uracil-DNA glycosylase family 4
MLDRDALLAALRFQLEAGADACIVEHPIDRFAPPPAPPPIVTEASPAAPEPTRPRAPAIASALALAPTGSAAEGATARAATCQTIEELRAAVEAFDGCALKDTATRTVFADGRPGSPLLIMGEAPGREEDKLGLPFVGESGKLLDRMLAAIGLDRRNVFISNVVYWRPPGNRTPSQEEIMACLPFARRLIELSRPTVVLALGNAAVQTLLKRSEGITRLRGRWVDYPLENRTVPLMPSFHPAFLLRQPGLKRESWRDFLAVRARLAEAGAWPPPTT